MKNLTQAEADEIRNFNHATQDLYEAIESGNYPERETRVQVISDDEHTQSDFDPPDATKVWPEEQSLAG